MRRFLVVIEKAENNYAAYLPDLPGCVATGRTIEEAEANIYEAILMHLKGLQEDGLPIPKPQSLAEYVVVPERALESGGSGKIRAFVFQNYVQPARARGSDVIKIRVGDVHKQMGLDNRMSQVCSALRSRKFEATYGVRFLRAEGPHQGANAIYWFALSDGSEPVAGR